ncbi:MATE family efflux transporter [uncultured Bacteroides sp.]|uniref:MATE family efflux transporter n=1 Tax=uncultured Bacteroides sp. TaxID=162156 RepID=UPI002AA7D616|nr:MATE family efflux transporter [uncultured Bacteroides sp.]
MSQQNNPHRLGTESIAKLLLQYSIPAIIGMTVTSLYNIIDSIFIGHGVGAMAISGLAITFPFMNLVMAFCTLVAGGGATISSIRLGQKDLNGATKVLGNTLMLCITNAIFFGTLSFIYLDNILLFFGASTVTLPYARDFMQVILIGTPISYIMIGLNNVMRATGYPKKAMLTSMVTVVANIILAPIFIFHFHWGIRGAAIATVTSQFIGMVWVLSHFINQNSYVHLRADFWKMNRHIIGKIFSIGLAPFLMNLCTCTIIVVINVSLQKHGGDMAIGAYGIINRLMTLFVMIVMGLTMGLQPIIGYNYGAKAMKRVKEALRLGIITGVSITTTGFLVCEFCPHLVSSMFTDNKELINMAAAGLRITIMLFPFVGCQIVISNFFQSIGKVKVSIFLSLSRQLVYLLPFLIILPRHYGVSGVWMSMPTSDFFAFFTAILCLIIYLRRNARHYATVE